MTSEYLKIPIDNRPGIVGVLAYALECKRKDLQFFQSRGDEEMVDRMKEDIAEAEAFFRVGKSGLIFKLKHLVLLGQHLYS